MVTVRSKALGDRRIVRLAQLAGYPGGDDEALGKMTRLWALCADQQTNTPEVRHIRACLGPRGEEYLVESGLGDDKHRDPSLDDGVYRVRGCDETDWYYALLEQRAQAEAGRARAATALRDVRGRFQPDTPLDQPAPASDLSPDLGSDLPDLLRPELPDLGAIVSAERGGFAEKLASIPARSSDDRRRKLFNDAWNYAALKHVELKAAGVDPHARNCWSGTPLGDSTVALRERIAELTKGDAPNWKAAEDLVRNRVDVAVAEARRDNTLRWFTPNRMWDRKSFARAAEMSPEQAAEPRTSKSPAPAAEPVRRMKTL